MGTSHNFMTVTVRLVVAGVKRFPDQPVSEATMEWASQ